MVINDTDIIYHLLGTLHILSYANLIKTPFKQVDLLSFYKWEFSESWISYPR